MNTDYVYLKLIELSGNSFQWQNVVITGDELRVPQGE
jgi:hypothetical protein